MPENIPADALEQRLKKIPEWEIKKDCLIRSFEFDEFMEGIDFVNGVAEIADEAHHHPDISIGYNVVKLSLTTHETGGITARDFELAARVDTLMD
ncbi:MAG: 4a-hydroxytetrahydrobiopterin dehydratase [Verrucomicrobiales bacterium]